MDQNRLVDRIRAHPDFHRVGMILTHHGVVRGTSRDGRGVSGVSLRVNSDQIEGLIESEKQTPGIVEILVEITEKKELSVGDDIMLIAVAGDIRDNVLSCMARMIDSVKQTVTSKTEYFV
ncbi:MAG: molybdenum cofactor biosynthesis protein MoaE [Desulfobacteraceae bacterium]|nr:molybdenum cofactor biosynthesis protein MoaE [Desulfobacteraceae bacterium]MCF8095390.1 molybdenum cofactor biosynthesis protein MoaE [Desulfobacteraceae bacterium]